MQKMLADAGKQMRDASAAASRIKELETQTAALVTEAGQAKQQLAALQQAKEEAQAQTASAQAALAAKPVDPAYPDLSGKVQELEAQIGSLQNGAAKTAVAATPDLSGRVSELETALAETKKMLAAEQAKPTAPVAAPAYPDLTGRVSELETALAQTKQQLATEQSKVAAAPVAAAPGLDPEKLQKQLAETEERLATALRGYALLEKERDSLAAYGNKATEAVSNERNALAAQVSALTGEVAQLRSAATAQADALTQAAALAAEKQSLTQRLAEVEARAAAAAVEATRANEGLAAFQRASAQNTKDLNATRALAQQLQGANAVLATENYQLKTMLSRPVTTAGAAAPVPAVAPTPAAVPAGRTHVVANGDSLSRISQRYYGAANRWSEIYNANRDKIGNDGVLRVGTELRIP
jgi:nucleoid-associated protein YgaU